MDNSALRDYRAENAEKLLAEFPSTSSRSLQLLLAVMLETTDYPSLTKLVETGLNACRIQGTRDTYLAWLAAGYFVSPSQYQTAIDALVEEEAREMVWKLRELSGRTRKSDGERNVSFDQLGYMISLTAKYFPPVPHPNDGWSGDCNPWDASDHVATMINQLSSRVDLEASELLIRLSRSADVAAYRDYVLHALREQEVRRIDAQFEQPAWRQVVATLTGAEPANIADLHALLCAHIEDLKHRFPKSNTDIYKHFWNEDSYGRTKTPKSEESARDVLVDELRAKVLPQRVAVEPEGHMANDKRADIAALLPPMKIVVELKRDRHKEVWSAIRDQLERFYTRDIDAKGFGIYGVFWYGSKCPGNIPHPPNEWPIPTSPEKMEEQLNSLIPPDKRTKIKAFVLDVSGFVPNING